MNDSLVTPHRFALLLLQCGNIFHLSKQQQEVRKSIPVNLPPYFEVVLQYDLLIFFPIGDEHFPAIVGPTTACYHCYREIVVAIGISFAYR